MQARDPKTGALPRPDGRPPFGLGPIARVPSGAAHRRGSATQERPAAPSAGQASPPPAALQSSVGRRPPIGFAVGRPGPDPLRVRAFGSPNLRRNVCPHFYVTGTRGAIPINAPHLLKGLVRQDRTVSRCQLRGGVHLEPGYVNDVCLSPRFNQCVFYEEDLTDR